MTKKQSTFTYIIAIFLLPLLAAALLYYIGYTGTLQNKGQWVSPPIALSEVSSVETRSDNFSWSIILPCPNACPEQTLLYSGISTLGAKSNLASIITLSQEQLSKSGIEQINFEKVYLADPSNMIVLIYDKTNLQDIIIDLKRLLKPIEKRT